VAGEFSTADRAIKIRDSITKAIQRFEPRIIPGTLSVLLRDKQGQDKGGGSITVDFDIAADMWAQPLPMELYLRSQVDITTGELKLERPSTASGEASKARRS
jgi:type VI secretion system protein ImpF